MNNDLFTELRNLSDEDAYQYVKKIAKKELEEESSAKSLKWFAYTATPTLFVLLILSLICLGGMTIRKSHYKQIHDAYRMYIIDQGTEADTIFLMDYRGTNPDPYFYRGLQPDGLTLKYSPNGKRENSYHDKYDYVDRWNKIK